MYEQRSGKVYQQSGVLPVYGGGLVLVTARRTGRWIIPKGHVKRGFTPADSAANEAFEEAGLLGRVVGDVIGTYYDRRPSGIYSIKVFPFEVESMLERWDEMRIRQRRLVSPEEAIGMIVHDELRGIVEGYFGSRSGG
jgi:8-oxo-dGTP pyrophosphatase MutT (NUDIX family)